VSLASGLVAQTAITELDPMVISANRVPTETQMVTSAVSVVPLEFTAEAQIDTLSGALAQTPGVSVVQTGAKGGPVSIFIRGGESDHTLFLVDGVRMNTGDASYTNFLGAADLAGVDRIEVLRGPQGTLYGSSALGGVIVVNTAYGTNGEPSSALSAYAGSFDSYGASISTRGSADDATYSFSLSTDSTDNDRPYNEFDQYSYSGRLATELTDRLTVGLTLRGQNTSAGAPGSVGSSFIGEVDTVNHLATAYAEWTASDELSAKLIYGWVQREYTYEPVPPPVGSPWDSDFYSRDTRNVVDLQTHWTPDAQFDLVAGINFETEDITTVTPTSNGRLKNDSQAAFALGTFRPTDHSSIVAGLRYDDFDLWGDATTWKLGFSHYLPESGTKLRANYGTGFNTPRPVYVVGGPFYSPNPGLEPEESEGWDIGVDQRFADGAGNLSLTYFDNNFTNKFEYDFLIPGIENIGEASSSGVEAAVTYAFNEALSTFVSYTYSNSENDTAGVPLRRRPEHLISAAANWQVTEAWLVGAGLSFAGQRYDGSATAPAKMPDYTVVRAYTHYDFGNGLRAQLRVENAFDEEYEAVRGYPSLPVAVYGGVEWRF
jgi:vitamin B12 transporter